MILNFGSINIDHVYRVPHMPGAGETLAVLGYEKFLGGKGANQSIAAAKSGAEIMHIGCVGTDGDWALQALRDLGVRNINVTRVHGPTGHAIIMVDAEGENQILIHGGANQAIAEDQIQAVLEQADPLADWVMLQNETNASTLVAQLAHEMGFKIVYSAAPFQADAAIPLLPLVSMLVVNETEAKQLHKALEIQNKQLDIAQLIVTKGAEGAEFHDNGQLIAQQAFKVDPIDTTGAGDTFVGAFVGRLSCGDRARQALKFASAASALQVTRLGAGEAIPNHDETMAFLASQAIDG